MRTAIQVARHPDGTVFIQVPESLRIVRDCAFEDIYYEHCSYFTAGSLSRLFESLGFEVVNTEVTYGDQYLTVEARPAAAGASRGTGTRADMEELSRFVAEFPARFADRVDEWGRKLRDWKAHGRRVVIWGSGSKGVSFLTTLPDTDVVSHAVDINPYRRGYYMSGTGQQIVSPQELQGLKPDVVIVMNRVYVPEIREALGKLGLAPDIHAL
jgi:hypothetical protein